MESNLKSEFKKQIEDEKFEQSKKEKKVFKDLKKNLKKTKNFILNNIDSIMTQTINFLSKIFFKIEKLSEREFENNPLILDIINFKKMLKIMIINEDYNPSFKKANHTDAENQIYEKYRKFLETLVPIYRKNHDISILKNKSKSKLNNDSFLDTYTEEYLKILEQFKSFSEIENKKSESHKIDNLKDTRIKFILLKRFGNIDVDFEKKQKITKFVEDNIDLSENQFVLKVFKKFGKS